MQPKPAHAARHAATLKLIEDALQREEALVQDFAACARGDHLLTRTTGTCRRCLTRFVSQIAVRRGSGGAFEGSLLIVLEHVEVSPDGTRGEPTVLDLMREFNANASSDALRCAQEIARSRCLEVVDGLNQPGR